MTGSEYPYRKWALFWVTVTGAAFLLFHIGLAILSITQGWVPWPVAVAVPVLWIVFYFVVGSLGWRNAVRNAGKQSADNPADAP